MTRSTIPTIPLLVAALLATPAGAADLAPENGVEAADVALEPVPAPRLGTLGGRTGIDAEIEWDAAGIEREDGIDAEEREEAHAVVWCRKRGNASP